MPLGSDKADKGIPLADFAPWNHRNKCLYSLIANYVACVAFRDVSLRNVRCAWSSLITCSVCIIHAALVIIGC